MTIFDFIIYMPLWMTLHDGIVDNPLNEIDRDIVTPVHRLGLSKMCLSSFYSLIVELIISFNVHSLQELGRVSIMVA